MNSGPPACDPHEKLGFEIAILPPVTAGSSSALTLIVDDDVGFLMWLGEVFTELGRQAVPALNCRQGLELVKRFNLPIDTLVINPELRGAQRIVRIITAASPGVRIVWICNSAMRPKWREQDKPYTIRAVLKRPPPSEPISRAEWVEKVRKMLS
jgi:hypothetical protein